MQQLKSNLELISEFAESAIQKIVENQFKYTTPTQNCIDWNNETRKKYTAFIESTLPESESKIIREHITSCIRCAYAVSEKTRLNR